MSERVRIREVQEQVQEQEQAEVDEAEVDEVSEKRTSQREEVGDQISLGKKSELVAGGEAEGETVWPIPSPTLRLPRPRHKWSGHKQEDNWDIAEEYRELRKVPRPESACESESLWDEEGQEFHQGQDNAEDATQTEYLRMPLPAAEDPVSQTESFLFLTSAGREGGDESDSGGSQSDGSVSAASVSGLSQAQRGRRAVVRPGPWLKPSQQRVTQVVHENKQHSLAREEEGLLFGNSDY